MTLEQSFSKVPQPDSGEVCTSKDDEALEDVEPFIGKGWQELDHDALEQHQYALFWFTPPAFHYYLPAFLLAGRANPNALFVVTLLQLLRQTSDAALARFRSDRWSRLNEEQLVELTSWLEDLRAIVARESLLGEEIRESLAYVRGRGWLVS